MKKRIQNIIKYNKWVYLVYYSVMSALIRFLGVFVKTDQRLILFNSFAGRKYDDSPKAVFDAMRADRRFDGYTLAWAFHEPERFDVTGAEKIKTDGLRYFVTALKAKVWITNSSVERGLKFKKKDTLYVNTWHGTTIKKMGSDIQAGNASFKPRGESAYSVMNAQGKYDTDIFSRAFGIERNKFLEVGLPRNDFLANYTPADRSAIRRALNFSPDQRVILYCPTFREYDRDERLGVTMAPPMDLNKWKKELGPDWVLLLRAHYEVSRVMKIEEDPRIRNVTDYPSLNDLMIASDLLISDYSSVFFDYSVMDKPMLHFTYDFDRYQAARGMYFDIRGYLNGADNEDDLLRIVKSIDWKAETDRTVRFRKAFVNFYGNAAKQTVDWIAAHL